MCQSHCMRVCTFGGCSPDLSSSLPCSPPLCVWCLCVSTSGSTLSAQSAPSVYPPYQALLLAPVGLPDPNLHPASGSRPRPLKHLGPSSENLCSAYTSEATLSVPSLCAPTQGRPHTAPSCLGLGSHPSVPFVLPSASSRPHLPVEEKLIFH